MWITAIVLAGGSGKRMNTDTPKQYLMLDGKPLLYYSLKAFEESLVNEIILVTKAGEEAYCRKEFVEQYGFTKVVADYKELTYEGYGVAGSAVIIVTLTDNINRTAGDVRAILGKHGGQLGQNGCVSYNFDNKGYIVVERTVELDEDTITEIALEAGADDVVVSDDVYEIFTDPDAFSDVRKFLEDKNAEMMAAAPKTRRNEEEEPKIRFVQAEVAMIPQNKITLPDDKVATFEKMIDALEELDDVQNVYHNVDLPYDDEE